MLIERGQAENPTILLVDDEVEVLESLADLLRREFHVLATPSVDDALALLQEREVAVLVTDQRMPKISGAELLSRSARISPETSRILLTAYSDVEAIIQAINDGRVYHYVAKPWDSEKLLDLIRAASERALLFHENQRLTRELERLSSAAQTSHAKLRTLRREHEILAANNEALRSTYETLKHSFWHLRKLQDVLPICLGCGKVKGAEARWQDVGQFLKEHSEFLSHGYCPDCATRILGDLDD